MKLRLTKLFPNRKKNENWVARTLTKKIAQPYYTIIIIVLLVFGGYGFMAYLDIVEMWDKNEILEKKIQKQIRKSNQLDSNIQSLHTEIQRLGGLSFNKEKLTTTLTQLCDILKSKEVIGGYQIAMAPSNTFANVLDVEIQVSYGDRELLLSATNMVLSKAFLIKSAERSRLGVKFELYSPYK